MYEWITSLDSLSFWLYFSGAFVGSVYLFSRAFSSLHKKRLIKDTPTSWLRSAAQGYTELVGRGIHIDGHPLTSPLSGRECLWYRIKVEDVSNSNDRLDLYHFITERLFNKVITTNSSQINESDDLFYLDDDTGRCVVDPDGAQITPSLTRSWYGNRPTPDRGPALSTSSLGYKYKYTEELLLPGDILYTIGDLKTQGGAGSTTDMQEETRDLLMEWKKKPAEILERFDQNKDGEISIYEWNSARKVAEQEIADKHASNDVPLVVTILSQTNDSRRPFMISSDPLHDLIDRYHHRSLSFFLASMLSSGLLAWAMNVRL